MKRMCLPGFITAIPLPFLAVAASLMLFSCAGAAPKAPVTALAMDGPPLALVGEYAGMPLEGSMERTCMAGYGQISLASADDPGAFSCTAEINAPPTEKGRIRGLLICTGDRRLPVSLRNLGPDQGVGIGKERDDGGLLIFFYHASREEADRRFPSVKQDIADARAARR